MFEPRPGYRLLPKANTDSNLSGIDEEPDEETYATRLGSTNVAPTGSSLWAVFICLLCTVVNLGLFHASSRTLPPSPASMSSLTRQDIFKLRRPSQYIRLDEISRPSPPVERQFKNYPIMVSQVDSSSPNKVVDGAAHMHMVHSGTIVPEEARVHVSPTVSPSGQRTAMDMLTVVCPQGLNYRSVPCHRLRHGAMPPAAHDSAPGPNQHLQTLHPRGLSPELDSSSRYAGTHVRLATASRLQGRGCRSQQRS